MSARLLSRRMNTYDLLERILSKTTLTSKRVGHEHVLDIGEDLLARTHVDVDAMKKAAVEEAIEASEKRHTRELRAALKRLRNEAEEDKTRAMEKQKQFYEDLAERVAVQRDRAEEEHMRELTRKHDREQVDALRAQWQECELLKEHAIQEANAILSRRLRSEFDKEMEAAISNALDEAAEMYRLREEETIAATKEQCEKEAADEAVRVAQLHSDDVTRLNHRYALLNQRYHKELDHRHHVEQDFRDLQNDYARFMNYTDGKYNSGFMMKIRHHGNHLAQKRINVVQYEEIETL